MNATATAHGQLDPQGAPSRPDYESTAATSERVAWRLDDLLDASTRFDFTRPLLPESLVRSAEIGFLDSRERLVLNHIRSHGYLCLFALVEEFILPYVLDQARGRLTSSSGEVRSLLQFAAEEAKHIELFRRFRAAFEKQFGHQLETLGPPEAVAGHVLEHSELGVALLILHIEWMTQRHYVDSVRADTELDDSFRNLLKHHWIEESQHARIDTWIVERLAAEHGEARRAQAITDYLGLCEFLDAGLQAQVAFDREGLQRVLGRCFSVQEGESFMKLQRQAQRRTFLGAGITHRRFVRTLDAIHQSARPARLRATQLYA